MITAARRITVVAPCLSRGGMTRAYFLGLSLQSAGYEAEVVGHLPANERVYPEPPSGLRVIPVEGRFPAVTRAIARRIDGDVVVSVKPMPTSFGAALLATRSDRRPVIADIDDWEIAFRRSDRRRETNRVPFVRRNARRARRALRRVVNPRDRFYLHWMERHLDRAALVTTNTRFLQKRFGGEYVPSGKDTDRFDPARFDPEESRRKLGLAGKFVVMFPGTAREHKGVDDAVEALGLLGRADARFVVVGGRAVGRDYTRRLMQRWPDRVVHLPRQGVDDMPMVVSAAHVVVVPQRDVETARAQFPIKLTDAMAMAKPIVTTPVGDIPEIVGGGAWIVPASSPARIADAIREIAGAPEEGARRGAIARARCVERLSVTAVGAKLKELVDRVTR